MSLCSAHMHVGGCVSLNHRDKRTCDKYEVHVEGRRNSENITVGRYSPPFRGIALRSLSWVRMMSSQNMYSRGEHDWTAKAQHEAHRRTKRTNSLNYYDLGGNPAFLMENTGRTGLSDLRYAHKRAQMALA
jgi:hypothetical protein